jgi:hypothetical protein
MAVGDRLASGRTVTVQGQKGKKIGRCVGAAAWLGVCATGAVGACSLARAAHTRACTAAAVWCGV